MQYTRMFKYVISYKVTYLETSSEHDNLIATLSFHCLPDARVDTSLIFSYIHIFIINTITSHKSLPYL